MVQQLSCRDSSSYGQTAAVMHMQQLSCTDNSCHTDIICNAHTSGAMCSTLYIHKLSYTSFISHACIKSAMSRQQRSRTDIIRHATVMHIQQIVCTCINGHAHIMYHLPCTYNSCNLHKSYRYVMYIQQLPCTDSSGHAINTQLPGGGVAYKIFNRRWPRNARLATTLKMYAWMYANIDYI
jgi:hypothetical protein